MNKLSAAALLCGALLGASAQAALVRVASDTVGGTFQYDFDAGIQVGADSRADVQWQQFSTTTRGLTVAFLSSATLLSLGSVNFDAITESVLMGLSYSTADIPGPPDAASPLGVGGVFAVKTNLGNYAKAIVTGYAAGANGTDFYDLQMDYALYDGQPVGPIGELPEPGALGLFALGAGALGWTRRRKPAPASQR
ncbi:PEP-CTERM sorting domain-containing protein [Pseudorhodoferax soli]|uniref:Putative secreted protein with PEP-CTERM sorting signal n=1 Tax=Pseudorhodoferax soli TaxID=545864 RepID=A0A368XP65_9BURK|nr:PEP-CTERM sorting domain-containing protein [Pseudorhodoferax soli]RCW68808.1 putative secreted protein with PEP-CTERM sorting signal [Pseudorhodoferax soli]